MRCAEQYVPGDTFEMLRRAVCTGVIVLICCVGLYILGDSFDGLYVLG